ncbi:MAG: AbrB/MazE/SpoVT family DNA-binding domain-containing protein [Nitrospirota bacterium]
METKLDKFGRVVLPKDIRDNLDLKPGQVLKIEKSDDELILKPLRKKSPLHVKDGVLVFSGTATGDMIGALRLHREERLKRVALQRRR